MKAEDAVVKNLGCFDQMNEKERERKREREREREREGERD